MSVVSLPRAFVFRVNVNDPHPTPWIRVKLSAASVRRFIRSPAWGRLAETWDSYYPLTGATAKQREVLRDVGTNHSGVGALLIDHRPQALGGVLCCEAMDTDELRPERLRVLLRRWRREPEHMYRTRPIVVFAAIGQGRMDGGITPEEESVVIGKLLSHWAVWSTLQAAAGCAGGSWQGLGCQAYSSAGRQVHERSKS